MIETALFLQFGAALAIGLLVGLEREYSFNDPDHEHAEHFAGIRTFSLMGLAGCLAAMAADILASPATFTGIVVLIGAFIAVAYFVDAWREIGLDVQIEATSYNQFQQKVRNGAYQIFSWGWVADYPDPENFLFLLTSEMARSKSGGPNTANFSDAHYDRLFQKMKVRDNDPERLAIAVAGPDGN